MYNFQSYDPATPRMVTSFKGNQKLIFEGYRYNIHHIVPAKNVKTWRCVCAKKLTSARSWCKGRAETWENDSHGTSKGEHNHPPEHDQAELEYFKSQLILAAIDFPDANLNDLVDVATSMMSEGVSFSSRESLKKSLTQARKSVENGGFKLKNYKNSAETTGSRSKVHSVSSSTNDDSLVKKFTNPVNIKLFENGTMASLLSLAKQCQETNNNNELDDTRSNPSIDDFQQSTSSASSSILNQFVNHDFEDEQNAPPTKLGRFDDPTTINEMFSSLLNSANTTFNTSGFASMGSLTNSDWSNSLIFDRSSNNVTNNGMDSNRSTPISNHGNNDGTTPKRKNDKTTRIDKASRAQRVNDIFNRLSTKAAANAASTTQPTAVSTANTKNIPVNGASSITSNIPQKVSIETQTDTSLKDGSEIRVSACLGSLSNCGCRVIRVCCCSDETCKRGIKRSHS